MSFLSLNRISVFVLILIYFIILIYDILVDLFLLFFLLVSFILSYFFVNFVIFGCLPVIAHRKLLESFIKVKDRCDLFHREFAFAYSSFLGMTRVGANSNHLHNSRLCIPSRINILIYLVNRFILEQCVVTTL